MMIQRKKSFPLKKYIRLKILTHSCYISFHLFLFKWFENKESAKIHWVQNYKQDSNYVFKTMRLYNLHGTMCAIKSILQSSRVLFRYL